MPFFRGRRRNLASDRWLSYEVLYSAAEGTAAYVSWPEVPSHLQP